MGDEILKQTEALPSADAGRRGGHRPDTGLAAPPPQAAAETATAAAAAAAAAAASADSSLPPLGPRYSKPDPTDVDSNDVDVDVDADALAASASSNMDREGRQLEDLFGGLSGSGYGDKCKKGIPVEQALFATLAAALAAFGFLFRAVTQAQGRRRRRRRRSLQNSSPMLERLLLGR